MDLHDSPEEGRFRDEIRSWLRENLPEGWGTPAYRGPGEPGGEPETGEERVAFGRAWQRRLYDGGWAGLSWPREFGGRGAGVIESMIYGQEYARARGPNLIQLSVGTALVGPTLIHHGTDAQKARFLEPILKGDEVWCQGFSEPGAGSDLANLRTRGDVEGDEIVVTGQKIWTSFAQHSQWCILIVRTDPDSQRHKGLTFVLVDMKSPGITIRPLVEMTGEAWFNEVFFDGVRVPVENVVGEIGRGWDVVMTTLNVERGSASAHEGLAVQLGRLVELARRTPRGDGVAADDPVIRQKLAQYASELMILRMTGYRNASRLARHGQPGPEGSILKIFWSELDQRIHDTALEILGAAGLVPSGDPAAVEDGFWQHELLWSRAATIYAGTSEIQRNIVAQRALGMPRG
ncbi:MAG: acyl-CoA dehydrogenase family protein [Deltaproteobacteria bacterium]|nr:acyl-CoA dehydrogenase family protein [Deltaproteobacteria bacterium]MBW2447493.1 acyl-CoA dehydrogenase family protein [Deltaproteobacteria bacterium]